MNKKSRLFITLLIVILLFILAVPAQAGPPDNAGGRWWYLPFIDDMKQAGCNTFITSSEIGEWTGTFVGDSTESGKVVAHCTGQLSFNATVTFDEVTVDGKQGGLVMSVNGTKPAGSEWVGGWVILSGTGDLANLHGQGTWWGPGAPGWEQWGYVDYAGKYHFEGP
jgi:hypothetical protein